MRFTKPAAQDGVSDLLHRTIHDPSRMREPPVPVKHSSMIGWLAGTLRGLLAALPWRCGCS
eukprot:3582174-Amphidinium_carterae.1